MDHLRASAGDVPLFFFGEPTRCYEDNIKTGALAGPQNRPRTGSDKVIRPVITWQIWGAPD